MHKPGFGLGYSELGARPLHCIRCGRDWRLGNDPWLRREADRIIHSDSPSWQRAERLFHHLTLYPGEEAVQTLQSLILAGETG